MIGPFSTGVFLSLALHEIGLPWSRLLAIWCLLGLSKADSSYGQEGLCEAFVRWDNNAG